MRHKPNVGKLFRVTIALFGAAIGCGIVMLVLRTYLTLEVPEEVSTSIVIFACLAAAAAFAGIGWAAAPSLLRLMRRWSGLVEGALKEMPLTQLIAGTVGLVAGLVIAALVTQLLRAGLPELLWVGLAALVYLVLGYAGASIGAGRWRELPAAAPQAEKAMSQPQAQAQPARGGAIGKILDTSVIIDGRIFDVCKTGFVEGPLIIPQFILAELRHIADSSDPLRRNRGRRGLDILAQIQTELDIAVEVTDADFDDVTEVDVKLLKLAQKIDGVVVTNDFNLNKVASVTGVKVLNLNDLAGALRPVLLPGEGMTVHIMREGKEYGQGIGYLDDGTMIVVDNGKRFIGQTVDVVVTTVLQTSAGRMIFTKMKAA